MSNSIVLLSGGIDSSTVLAHAVRLGHEILCLTFDYNQKHINEIKSASRVVNLYKQITHKIIKIDFSAFNSSALLTGDQKIPKNRTIQEITGSIPVTYVPARNIIFLSYALAWAENHNAEDIFIGANSVDQFGYPDCRRGFFDAFEKMATIGTKLGVESVNGIRINSPLINLSKSEIIKLGLSYAMDYSLTSSCYEPTLDNVACGQCDACIIRLKAFQQLGIKDPLKYVSHDNI